MTGFAPYGAARHRGSPESERPLVPGRPAIGRKELLMGLKKYKPTSPGRRFQSVSDFAEITSTDAREVAVGAAAQEGRSQQQRAHHDPSPGRRPQAPLPRDRLQAQQGRRAGQGRDDRVRPEPLGPHRAAALRGRREALHPGAQGPQRRRHDHERSRMPTSSPATRCRWPTSRSVRSCTPSSSSRARAPRSLARRVPRSS